MKPIYRAVKHICEKSTSTQTVFPKKASGESCTSEEEALLRWTEYYTTALNHPASQPCPDLDALATSATDDPNISVDASSLVEVQAAIAKLKNGRASGADGITAEVLKYSAGTSAPAAGQAFRISLEIWEGTSGVEGRYHRLVVQGQGVKVGMQ